MLFHLKGTWVLAGLGMQNKLTVPDVYWGQEYWALPVPTAPRGWFCESNNYRKHKTALKAEAAVGAVVFPLLGCMGMLS